MGKGFIAVAVTFIVAGMVYQIVKPKSQGPQVFGTIGDTLTGLSGDLFKDNKKGG